MSNKFYNFEINQEKVVKLKEMASKKAFFYFKGALIFGFLLEFMIIKGGICNIKRYKYNEKEYSKEMQ